LKLSTHPDWKTAKRGDHADPVAMKPRGWLSEKLSPRQAQICQMLFDGLTCKEIAERLNLSCKTAQTHIDNSYRKLGVRNRAQLYHRMMAIMPPTEEAGLVERVARLEKRLDLIAQVFQSFEALAGEEAAGDDGGDVVEDELDAQHC
jgi:DNA-binding CsgD family transcriptional regulator